MYPFSVLIGTVDTAIIHGLYMTNFFLTVLEARKATAKLLKSDVQVQTQVQCLRAHLLFSVSLRDRKGEGLDCTGTDLFQSPLPPTPSQWGSTLQLVNLGAHKHSGSHGNVIENRAYYENVFVLE